MSTKSSRLSLKRYQAALLVVAFALLAILIYGYTRYAAARPSSVLEQALAQTMQLQSAGFAVESSETVQTAGGDKKGATWQVSGHVDRQGRVDATGQYAAGNGQKVSFMLRNPQGGTSQTTYVQVTGAEYLPGLLGDVSTAYGLPNNSSPLKNLNGRWLEVPAFLRQAITQNWLFVSNPSGGLTSGEQQQLVALYKRHAFVHVTKSMADETVDGATVRHYRVRLDAAQLGTYLQAVKRDISRLQVTDTQISDAGNFVASVGDIEVWVGRQDNLIHKVTFEQSDNAKRTDVSLRFNDFNKAVTATRPTDSKPMFDVLTGLQSKTKR